MNSKVMNHKLILVAIIMVFCLGIGVKAGAVDVLPSNIKAYQSTIETHDGISPNDMNLILGSNQTYSEPTPWETGKYEEAFTVGDYTYYSGPLRDENGVSLHDSMYALCMYNNKTREDVSIMYRLCRVDLIGNKIFAIGNGVSSGWWHRQLVIYDIGAKTGNKIVSGVYMPFVFSDEPYFTYNDRIYVCYDSGEKEDDNYFDNYSVISLNMNGEDVRVEVEPVHGSKVELHETYAIIDGARYNYKYASNNDIRVILDGSEIEFDVPPQIINDRTMVPMRAIFEALGYEVSWNGETNTASAKKGGHKKCLAEGKSDISCTNRLYKCDTAPRIVNDRLLVPARAVAECAGCSVEWDGDNKIVSITSGNMSDINGVTGLAYNKIPMDIESDDAVQIYETFRTEVFPKTSIALDDDILYGGGGFTGILPDTEHTYTDIDNDGENELIIYSVEDAIGYMTIWKWNNNEQAMESLMSSKFLKVGRPWEKYYVINYNNKNYLVYENMFGHHGERSLEEFVFEYNNGWKWVYNMICAGNDTESFATLYPDEKRADHIFINGEEGDKEAAVNAVQQLENAAVYNPVGSSMMDFITGF